jgi:hypothetical protein
MSVWRGTGNLRTSQVTGRANNVLDNDRNSAKIGELLGDNARSDVGGRPAAKADN